MLIETVHVGYTTTFSAWCDELDKSLHLTHELVIISQQISAREPPWLHSSTMLTVRKKVRRCRQRTWTWSQSEYNRSTKCHSVRTGAATNDSHFRRTRRGAHEFRTHEWLTYSSLTNEQVDRLTVSFRDSMRCRRRLLLPHLVLFEMVMRPLHWLHLSRILWHS